MEKPRKNEPQGAGASAAIIRTLLETKQDAILPFSREAVEAVASSLEYAAAEASELRDAIDRLERRRIIPAPRCWYYERHKGDCSNCTVHKWCRIRQAYKGTIVLPDEERGETNDKRNM